MSFNQNPYLDYGYDVNIPDVSGLNTLPPNVSKALDVVLGRDAQTQSALTQGTKKIAKAFGRAKPGRFAKSAAVQKALRFVPGLGAATTALTVLDTLSGDESLGNKGMDLALMGGGAAIGGSVIPIVGAPIGSMLGKAASDGIQYVLGGGKSPEEQKLEEALKALRGGSF